MKRLTNAKVEVCMMKYPKRQSAIIRFALTTIDFQAKTLASDALCAVQECEA
jgi:hypothetical protein